MCATECARSVVVVVVMVGVVVEAKTAVVEANTKTNTTQPQTQTQTQTQTQEGPNNTLTSCCPFLTSISLTLCPNLIVFYAFMVPNTPNMSKP